MVCVVGQVAGRCRQVVVVVVGRWQVVVGVPQRIMHVWSHHNNTEEFGLPETQALIYPSIYIVSPTTTTFLFLQQGVCD